MKEINRDFWKKWENRDNFMYFPVVYSVLLNKNYFEEWEDVMWYYNYLISGYDFNRNMLSYTRFFDIVREKGFFLSDSGGFQVYSLGAFINPRRLVRYQSRLTNMGFILDSPPYKPLGENNKALSTVFDFDNFDEHLNKTIMWTRKMVEDLDDSSFSLGGIVHGVSYDTMSKWYDSISDLYDFKFWALGVKPPNDLFRLVKFLKFAEKKNINSIHLLAVSGVKGILFLLYYQRYLNEKIYITFDSSTPIKYSSLRTMIFWGGDNLVMRREGLSGVKLDRLNVEYIYDINKDLVEKSSRLKEFFKVNWNRKFRRETDLNIFLYFCNIFSLLDMIDYLRRCDDDEFKFLFRKSIKNHLKLLSLYERENFGFSSEIKKRGLF